MLQYYKIAGLTVEMDSFGRAEDHARPYMIDFEGEPDIRIEADWTPWKERTPNLSDATYEYLATGKSFYTQLLNFDGIMVHSSALVLDGKAYLFSAPCGTGKSTHVSLWRRVFGDERVRVLNDDKPALRMIDGVWYAYGTPWSGKTAQNLNICAPLAGIAMIERSETNEIVPFGGVRAAHELMEQTARPPSAESRAKLLELMNSLLEKVPVWKLKCTPTVDAALVSQKAMAAEAQKRFG